LSIPSEERDTWLRLVTGLARNFGDSPAIDASASAAIRTVSPAKKIIMGAVIDPARELGLDIVAEGIETEVEESFCRR
jgi:sensor c-di-GMP phosphodiesterase-like protein